MAKNPNRHSHYPKNNERGPSKWVQYGAIGAVLTAAATACVGLIRGCPHDGSKPAVSEETLDPDEPQSITFIKKFPASQHMEIEGHPVTLDMLEFRVVLPSGNIVTGYSGAMVPPPYSNVENDQFIQALRRGEFGRIILPEEDPDACDPRGDNRFTCFDYVFMKHVAWLRKKQIMVGSATPDTLRHNVDTFLAEYYGLVTRASFSNDRLILSSNDLEAGDLILFRDSDSGPRHAVIVRLKNDGRVFVRGKMQFGPVVETEIHPLLTYYKQTEKLEIYRRRK
jgi:hypothetical protein